MTATDKMNVFVDADTRVSKRGFTLIELLTVIAILAILSSISFGVFKGVQSSQNRAKAKAELAVLSQSLEKYKSAYGDYPWTSAGNPTNSSPDNRTSAAMSNSELLLNALMGWGNFKSVGGKMQFDPKAKGKVILDAPKFTIRKRGSDDAYVDYPVNEGNFAPKGYYLADPMGNPYVYIYAQDSSRSQWDLIGYHLYSKGTDSIDSARGINLISGVIDDEDGYRYNAENADNIYVGE